MLDPLNLMISLHLRPLRSASKYLTSHGTGKNKQFSGLAEIPIGALFKLKNL